MARLTVCNHPLLSEHLACIRDRHTEAKAFRDHMYEAGMMLAYEMSRDLPTIEAEIQTPLTTTVVRRLSQPRPGFIPVLRAGLGLLEGALQLFPDSKVGHIGLYRNEESLEPVEYYFNVPVDEVDIGREWIVVDPMLATGGSLVAALDLLVARGVRCRRVMALIATPEGVRRVQDAHPDVHIYAAAVDEKLNENGYIVPGLGDAGDRLYGG